MVLFSFFFVKEWIHEISKSTRIHNFHCFTMSQGRISFVALRVFVLGFGVDF